MLNHNMFSFVLFAQDKHQAVQGGLRARAVQGRNSEEQAEEGTKGDDEDEEPGERLSRAW